MVSFSLWALELSSGQYMWRFYEAISVAYHLFVVGSWTMDPFETTFPKQIV